MSQIQQQLQQLAQVFCTAELQQQMQLQAGGDQAQYLGNHQHHHHQQQQHLVRLVLWRAALLLGASEEQQQGRPNLGQQGKQHLQGQQQQQQGGPDSQQQQAKQQPQHQGLSSSTVDNSNSRSSRHSGVKGASAVALTSSSNTSAPAVAGARPGDSAAAATAAAEVAAVEQWLWSNTSEQVAALVSFCQQQLPAVQYEALQAMVLTEPRVLEVGAAGDLSRALERLEGSYLCRREVVQQRWEHWQQLQELEEGALGGSQEEQQMHGQGRQGRGEGQQAQGQGQQQERQQQQEQEDQQHQRQGHLRLQRQEQQGQEHQQQRGQEHEQQVRGQEDQQLQGEERQQQVGRRHEQQEMQQQQGQQQQPREGKASVKGENEKSAAAATQLAVEFPQLLLVADRPGVKQQLLQLAEALLSAGVALPAANPLETARTVAAATPFNIAGSMAAAAASDTAAAAGSAAATMAAADDVAVFRRLCSELEMVTGKEPVLLTVPAAVVVRQLQQLCRGLAADPADVWGVVLLQPALLGRSWQQLQAVLRVICGLLKLPYAELKQQLVEAAPSTAASQGTTAREGGSTGSVICDAERTRMLNLLLLTPRRLERSYSLLLEATVAAGLKEGQLRAMLRKEPWLLLQQASKLSSASEEFV